MSMSDTVADMLTRIRNAHMIRKTQVSVPASKLKESIIKVLAEEGYITGYEVTGKVKVATKQITIGLKYYNNEPVISNITRISKPSLRVYSKSSEIPEVMNGLGVVVISTSKGVMSDKNAKALNVGGEVLCSVE